MQRALGESVAEIETLKQENEILRAELIAARHERAYLGDID